MEKSEVLEEADAERQRKSKRKFERKARGFGDRRMWLRARMIVDACARAHVCWRTWRALMHKRP